MGKVQQAKTLVDTKRKGLTTELLCQAYLTSLGYNISIPLGEDCRYDMILDIKKQLLRVQIKTCIERPNGIQFSTKSTTTSGKENIEHKYSKDEIDLFGTYYNDCCYLIPIEECSGHQRSLSFSPVRKNASNPLYIEDYRAEVIIEKLLNNNYNCKELKIYQYDLDDNLINSFSSYAEAGEYLNKSPVHINQCARGLRKTAYGYKWSFAFKE